MADKTCDTCRCSRVCDRNKWGFENCNNYISVDAEAYKEFAERLKSEFETTHLYGKDIVDRRIDNLLKEMEGEGK